MPRLQAAGRVLDKPAPGGRQLNARPLDSARKQRGDARRSRFARTVRYHEVDFQEEPPLKFRIVVETDEDGVFVATVPSLPGCVSQGATRSEALSNVREAIEGYLESLRQRGEPIPPSIHEEVIDVAV